MRWHWHRIRGVSSGGSSASLTPPHPLSNAMHRYDIVGISFLFNLNSANCLDSIRVGNKARFFNHSDTPNCYCKVRV